MRRLRVGHVVGASVLLGTLAFAQTSPATPERIVLRAARMFDARSDSLINDPVIVVEGNKISAVGSGLAIPAGARVLDLGDVTLMPGLIDAHTHLLWEIDGTDVSHRDIALLATIATQSTAERALLGARTGREDLESGITTVRDLGNSGVNGDVALRTAINRGWIPGPRIVAATRALAPQGGQFGPMTPAAQPLIEEEYVTVRGAESARQAVRQALYDDADCIKVIVNGTPASVTPEEMKAIVDEAHRNKKKVAAHAVNDAAARIAVEAGVDSVEHGYTISDETLKIMVQKHIFLVPTDFTLQMFADATFAKPPTAAERAEFDKRHAPSRDHLHERLQRAVKLGVPIAMGSDQYLIIRGKTRGQASLDVVVAMAEGCRLWQFFMLRPTTLPSCSVGRTELGHSSPVS